MSERFQPCTECGYAVKVGEPHCPDCGLILSRERSLFGRLLGRKDPTHHPDNLRAVEARVATEIERLDAQLAHLRTTKASLASTDLDIINLELSIEESHGLLERQILAVLGSGK